MKRARKNKGNGEKKKKNDWLEGWRICIKCIRKKCVCHFVFAVYALY